jgi:hypothetical protein
MSSRKDLPVQLRPQDSLKAAGEILSRARAHRASECARQGRAGGA